MDKIKVKSYFENLERLCASRGSGRIKDDDMAQFRFCSQRILNSLENSSERVYRDLVLKNNAYITLLITTLQIVNDRTVQMNVVKIFSDLIGKQNMGRRAQIISQAGGTQTLFNVMLYESKDNAPSEEFLFLLHQVLYKLGLKDRKFSSKARLCQVLPVTLNLLRQMGGSGQLALMTSNTAKNLQVILHVIKLYSSNHHNASTLGRNGAITYLLRILLACGKKHLVLLKITLDTLHSMVKTKSNSARAVGQNAISFLLDSFLDWHKSDTKNKQMPQKKAILNVLKQLVNLKSGRRSLIEHNGLFSLYDALINIKHTTETEPIVTSISHILRRCFPRNRLPVSSYDSVLQCPLPTSLTGDNVLVKRRSDLENAKYPMDYGDDSPIDEDDDLSSDDAVEDLDLACPGSSLPHLLGGNKAKGNSGSNQSGNLNKRDSISKQREPARSNNPSKQAPAASSSLSNKRAYTDANQADSEASTYPDNADNDSDSSPINIVKTERSLEDLTRDYERFFPELIEFPVPKLDEYESPDNQFNDNHTIEKPTFTTATSVSTNNSPQKIMKKSNSTPTFNLQLNFDSMLKNNANKSCEGSSGEDSKLHRSLTSSEMYGGTNHSPIRARQRATPPNLKTTQQSNSVDVIPNISGQSMLLNPITDNGKSQSVRRGSITAVFPVGQKLSPQKSNMGTPKKKLDDKTKKISPLLTNCQQGDTGHDFVQVSKDKAILSLSKGDSVNPEEEEDEGYRNEHTAAYMNTSASTRSLAGFFSILGYPDLIGCEPNPHSETFHEKKKSGQLELQQNKLHEDFRRVVDPSDIINKVVFDLDTIMAEQEKVRKHEMDYAKISSNSGDAAMGQNQSLSNMDEISIDQMDYRSNHLIFESRFESGNLRKAIHVRQYEYDLVLNPDINTNHHVQWFYFRVSNIEHNVPYRFNIINCEKPNSQFNFGMKPVLFSVKEALYGRTYWRRVGTEICYYKNHFVRSVQTTGGVPGRTYYTATFVVTFPHEGDVCYLAYHYPYTYSHLMSDIELLKKKIDVLTMMSTSGNDVIIHCCNEDSRNDCNIYFKVQELTKTLLGNSLPLLTITSSPNISDNEALKQFHNRPYIYLTSRVHPGESNSSWVMRGTIQFLLSKCEAAKNLRNAYIFKIIPMLNPDGVIMGSHRCSMSGEDLNRRWLDPCPTLHPTIYHAKGIALYLTKIGKAPLIYCDYHGHSRKKNVFMYGCSSKQSWMTEDTDNPAYIDSKMENLGYRSLPKILQSLAPAFSWACCNFSVEKAKESTARVVVWRECRILRSYTMESSYCGCDQGPYKGTHLSTRELEEMGARFAEAIVRIQTSSIMAPHMKGVGVTGDGDICGPSEFIHPELEDTVGGAVAMANKREEEDDDIDLDLDCADDDQIDSDGDNWSEPSDNEPEDDQ